MRKSILLPVGPFESCCPRSFPAVYFVASKSGRRGGVSILGPPLPLVTMTTAVDDEDDGGDWGGGWAGEGGFAETGVALVCASAAGSLGRMGAAGTPTPPRHTSPFILHFCFLKTRI